MNIQEQIGCIAPALNSWDAATWAAIGSAIAAAFSALAAFLICRIERRHLLESIRPDIVLDGWTRAPRGDDEVIAFESVRNIGRGAAHHVLINCMHTVNRRPTATLDTKRFPILAPNQTVNIPGEIRVCWRNVEAYQGGKSLQIAVEIDSNDSRGMHHYEWRYTLFASEFPTMIAGGGTIAPGLSHAISTSSQPLWLYKLRLRFARVRPPSES